VTSLSLISIALLALGSLYALALLARSGETRTALLAGALGLLALAGALPLLGRFAPAQAPLLDLAAAMAGLAGSAFAALGGVALARTLRERDRAEALHWDGMEAVRALGELSERPGLELQEKLASLLRAGCARFGLELGLVARVTGDRYEVVAFHGPSLPQFARGTVLPLADTFCGRTLASGRTLAIADAGASLFADHPARRRLGLEAYLGAEIRAGGQVFGTLAFSGRAPRAHPLTATDKDLALLMARFVGLEIDRAVAAELVKGTRGAAPATRAQPPGASPEPLDLNAALRRLDRPLRRLAGPRVHLVLRLAPGLFAVRADRLPLRPILMSLAGHALDGMREGGELRIETANLAGRRGGGAGAEPPFVTLRVRSSGASLGGAALERAFEAEPAPGPGSGEERLPLPALRRLLQRCGGDLSIEVEPGRASSYTLFLPAAAPLRGAPDPRPAPPPAPGA
jgi:hypothetical protein